MIEFSVLSSGSRANCLYLASKNIRVLVDCGLSAKKAAERLRLHGIDPDTIDAIVISHEHSDHIAGVRVFAARHRCKVFINQQTLAASPELNLLPSETVNYFDTGLKFSVGDLSFEPFSINHDALDPVGFRVTFGKVALGIITDLGQLTNLVRAQARGLSALVLESNHDLKMLQECDYPWELKQRISSRSGHLSNETAGLLAQELSAENEAQLRYLIAAHISENANTPELAVEGLESAWRRGGCAQRPEIIAASAATNTPMYSISS